MKDVYENPLCSRYASEKMQHLFSPQWKFSTFRRLWLALAESDGTKNTTQITVTNDENQVQSNMTARYNAVLSAQNELRKAELNLQNQQTTLGRVTRSYAAGAASARDLEDAQYSAAAAEYTVKLDRYALQSAYFSYLAGRDGLAGSSAS